MSIAMIGLNYSPIIPVIVVLWLTPLAIFDVLKREIPHIGWVALPCLIVGLTAWLNGNWTLALLAAVVTAGSERHWLPSRVWRSLGLNVAIIACVTLTAFTPLEQLTGAIAIIGFWLAYEAGWWAGVDALVAMSLAMVWPETRLLVSFVLGHAVVILLLGRLNRIPKITLRRISSEELECEGAPGLPALLLTAVFLVAWKTWWPLATI